MTLGERLHGHCQCLPEYRIFKLVELYSEYGLEISGHLVVHYEGDTAWPLSRSELSLFVVIWGRWSWNVRHSVMTLGRETAQSLWTLFRSPRTELFQLVELYSWDDLEMAGYLVVPLGTDCMVTVEAFWQRPLWVSLSYCKFILWSWNVCLCMLCDKVPVLQEEPLWLH